MIEKSFHAGKTAGNVAMILGESTDSWLIEFSKLQKSGLVNDVYHHLDDSNMLLSIDELPESQFAVLYHSGENSKFSTVLPEINLDIKFIVKD